MSGYRPGVEQGSFGIEMRSGGHTFQINFSNGIRDDARAAGARRRQQRLVVHRLQHLAEILLDHDIRHTHGIPRLDYRRWRCSLACGGGSPNSPSGGGVTVIVRDGGTGGASGATVTIAAARVGPGTVTVAVGQTVTFINNNNRAHEMASDPHPQHGSCPAIEAGLGSIARRARPR